MICGMRLEGTRPVETQSHTVDWLVPTARAIALWLPNRPTTSLTGFRVIMRKPVTAKPVCCQPVFRIAARMHKDPQTSSATGWGKLIAEARLRAGLSQTELAEKLVMSQSAIADWEKEKTRPRAHLWSRIDQVLEINLSQILMPSAKLATNRKRRGDSNSERIDYLDLPVGARRRAFLFSFAKAIEREDIEVTALEFANSAIGIWERREQGPLRTEEARLSDAIEGRVQFYKLAQSGESDPDLD